MVGRDAAQLLRGGQAGLTDAALALPERVCPDPYIERAFQGSLRVGAPLPRKGNVEAALSEPAYSVSTGGRAVAVGTSC